MNIKDTPIPVRRAIRKLGRDLSEARRRRRIPMRIIAERASISRATLGKVERGDEGVSLGAYARVLFSLGMIQRLVDLADPKFDILGLGLEAERLPKRIRMSPEERSRT